MPRRAPAFEGRRPSYGSFVVGSGRRFKDYDEAYDVVDLSVLRPADARGYADGRSAYLVRKPGHPPKLACFERLMQMEADLVRLQEATGAHIVAAHRLLRGPPAVHGRSVITWTGRVWEARPTANAVLPALCAAAPAIDEEVVAHTLELAVHWLGPARAGRDVRALRGRGPVGVPRHRHGHPGARPVAHEPSALLGHLRRARRQHDLATIVAPDGRVLKIGVGLRTSPEAYARSPPTVACGTVRPSGSATTTPRSRSIVVSESGPVTVFRQGEAIAASGPEG